MDKRQTERFQKRLEEERNASRLSIRRSRSEEDDRSGITDEADVATSTFQTELSSTLHDSEVTRLKAIEDALHRLDTPQWGLCANCEQSIPEARLNAVPWATLCVRCQDLTEQIHSLAHEQRRGKVPAISARTEKPELR